jgi:MFS family permease
MPPTEVRRGFASFALIWIGQVVSLFGSGLTAFALGVWVYQETGSVTRFTLIAFFATLPAIALSPLAGALVDRWDRKRAMILADAGAAAATAVLVVLLATDQLALWHIYLIVAVASAFGTLQFPAFSAAVTLLVPKEHFGRAGGMMQFGDAGGQILAPLAAGALLVSLGLAGVVAIDLATFVFAVATLLFVRVPSPPPVAAPPGAGARPSLLAEAGYGWTYIRARRGLLGLLGYFAMVNLLVPFCLVLATPLVLSFTTADRLGVVLAAGSAGGLAGGLAMSVWGGPKRRILGIVGLGPLGALGFALMGLRPSVPLVAAGLFVVFFAVPFANGCSQAIWQSKVEPAVQGRVFAVRRMIAQATAPVAFLIAGPIADHVFEPLLAAGGPLAASGGRLLGTGPGRGIALLLITLGAVLLAGTALALASRRFRRLEDDLPDALPAAPVPAA